MVDRHIRYIFDWFDNNSTESWRYIRLSRYKSKQFLYIALKKCYKNMPTIFLVEEVLHFFNQYIDLNFGTWCCSWGAYCKCKSREQFLSQTLSCIFALLQTWVHLYGFSYNQHLWNAVWSCSLCLLNQRNQWLFWCSVHTPLSWTFGGQMTKCLDIISESSDDLI